MTVMRLSSIAASALLFVSSFVFADDLYIEAKSLAPVPAAVSAAVTDKADLLDIKTHQPCKLVGMKVSLEKEGEPADYFVTTADACGWGRVGGPIWFVRAEGDHFRMVLSSGGYVARLSRTQRNGLQNILLTYSSAGKVHRVGWRYDGAKYVSFFKEVGR